MMSVLPNVGLLQPQCKTYFEPLALCCFSFVLFCVFGCWLFFFLRETLHVPTRLCCRAALRGRGYEKQTGSSLVVLRCLPASHLPSVWVGMLLEQLAAALQGECPGCGAVSPQPAGSALCVWSRADHLQAQTSCLQQIISISSFLSGCDMRIRI